MKKCASNHPALLAWLAAAALSASCVATPPPKAAQTTEQPDTQGDDSEVAAPETTAGGQGGDAAAQGDAPADQGGDATGADNPAAQPDLAQGADVAADALQDAAQELGPDGSAEVDGAGSADAADAAPDATGDAVADVPADVPAIADAVPDIAADAVADEVGAPPPDVPADAAPDTAGADAEIWFPSWKDKNGCENYQYFEDGVCKNESPKQEKLETTLCWKTGQVNSLGVGKPCQVGLGKCAGLTANCCATDAKLYGALCTMPCTSSAECGENAYCHTSPMGGSCFPKACTELFDVFYENAKKKDKGFACAAPANEKGVGTLCKAGGAACQGIAGAYCLGDGPYYLPANMPSLNSFCTIPCASNADCGSGAQCIFTNGKPYFCSPTSCAAQFDGILFMNKPPGSGMTEGCVPE